MMNMITKGLSTICTVGLLAGCSVDADGNPVNIMSDIRAMTGGQSAPAMTADQRELQQLSRDYSAARVNSALAGAAAGALLGALLGNDSRDIAIGAGVGAAGGYLAGSYLVRDNQNFQADAQALQADIQAAQRDTADLQASVNSSRRVLNYQQGETARLNAAYRSGNAELAQLQAQESSLRRDLENTRDVSNTARERVSTLNALLGSYRQNGLSTNQLEAELERQRQFVAALQEAEAGYIDLIEDLPPEVIS